MTDHKTLGSSVLEARGWLEALDLSVKVIWLNPKDGHSLWHDSAFDRGVSQGMIHYVMQNYGAPLLGYFFGSMVLTSDKIPERHIAMLPEGFEPTKLLDSAAAVPLPGLG